MVSRITSVAFRGIETVPVDVQVQQSNGMPSVMIVGLGDKAVSESKERVRSALTSIGIALPPKRFTINLSPADLAKEGSIYDLPIALGILQSMGIIAQDVLDEYLVLGELALDGSISATKGVLPSAMYAATNNMGIICPETNGNEARYAGELDIIAPHHLLNLIPHLKGDMQIKEPELKPLEVGNHYPDISDIVGQQTAKRALEIAAAGGHHLLMMGPPGAGKSMLASRLGGLLPDLTTKEMLEISVINSVAGNMDESGLVSTRPYRDPHHNCSMPALIGGGNSKVRPGEVTLAHKGVLFLDELPEFQRGVLDALRQPLETRNVSIARAEHHITYPADFQLIAAMNPCRCGYLDDPDLACTKAPQCSKDYLSKLSGPLLDRFDLAIEVPAIKPNELRAASADKSGESSADIRARVTRARNNMIERNKNYNANLNTELGQDALDVLVPLDDEGANILDQAVEKMKLSMRGYHRVLRVARTIADLEGGEFVTTPHLVEALSYRLRWHKYS